MPVMKQDSSMSKKRSSSMVSRPVAGPKRTPVSMSSWMAAIVRGLTCFSPSGMSVLSMSERTSLITR